MSGYLVFGRDGTFTETDDLPPDAQVLMPVTDDLSKMTGFAYSWAGHIHPAGGDEGRVIYDQRYPDGCPICGTIA